jgi:hypothetical protein
MSVEPTAQDEGETIVSITISTTVDIDAPKQVVWDVLTDFNAYPEWNPHMKIEGTAQMGTRLTVHMGARGGRGMALKPTVLAATSDHELRWLGKLGFGGIVDGEHFFILERNADGTTSLTHGERYSGALVALMKPFLNKRRNQAGYEDFNRVLKQRVESVRDTT